MAECGADYAHLLTIPGGYDVEDPCGWWCNEPVVSAWDTQATHVYSLYLTAWNRLIRAEREAGGDHSVSDAIIDQLELYDAEYAALPEPSGWMAFGAAGAQEAATAMATNVSAGACALDLVNRALEEVGGVPIEAGVTHKPGLSTGWKIAIGVGAVVAVGGAVGAYYWLRDDDEDEPSERLPTGESSSELRRRLSRAG